MAEEADARASDRERDDTVTGLQAAFAEGRLDDLATARRSVARARDLHGGVLRG